MILISNPLEIKLPASYKPFNIFKFHFYYSGEIIHFMSYLCRLKKGENEFGKG